MRSTRSCRAWRVGCGRSGRPASRRSAAAPSPPTSSTAESRTASCARSSLTPVSAPWSLMSDVAEGIGLEETRSLEERYLMRTYKRAPVDFVKGEGPLLWDAEGKKYLDFLTGISVCSVGHCHPEVVKAVRDQAHRLMHVSNLFYSEPMAQLAEGPSAASPCRRAFFSN